jgi:hypothetical protein
MGGIYGSAVEGAYSIVTSMIYEDLDEDHGNVLFYSGSDSHENTNPNAPATSTAGSKSLLEPRTYVLNMASTDSCDYSQGP